MRFRRTPTTLIALSLALLAPAAATAAQQSSSQVGGRVYSQVAGAVFLLEVHDDAGSA